MKILIVGGGIAGLTLAAFLKKHDLAEVVMVEKAPEFDNIGFVLGLWGNGRSILRKLGIEKSVVEENGYELPWIEYKSPNDKTLLSMSMDEFRQFGANVVISRADIHQGLVGAAAGTDIRFNTVVTKISQTDNKTVEVEFNNNTKDTFDLIVGADGVKSSVRELVFGSKFLKYYGWGIWVYWLPTNLKTMPLGCISIGRSGKMAAIFPYKNNETVCWFITTNPINAGRPVEKRREMLLKYFSGWKHPLTEEMLKFVPEKNEDIFYADVAHVDMQTWYKGKVVLIGDAKHATSPVSGMGAGLAMEDAYVLFEELSKLKEGSTKNIEAMLEKFATRRNPRIKKYRRAGRRMDYFAMVGGVQGKIRDFVLPFIPASFFAGPFTKMLREKP